MFFNEDRLLPDLRFLFTLYLREGSIDWFVATVSNKNSRTKSEFGKMCTGIMLSKFHVKFILIQDPAYQTEKCPLTF